MTLKGVVVTAGLLAACLAATAESAQPPADPPDARIGRLEYWLRTALHLNPGVVDDGLVAVGAWPTADLQSVGLDVSALVRLIRSPSLVSESAVIWFSFNFDRKQAPQPVRYSIEQVQRLKQIACAIGNLHDAPQCEWTRGSLSRDTGLTGLATLAESVRRGDDNFILRRGALMHADIAMLGLGVQEPLAFGSSGMQSFQVTISDGRQTGVNQSEAHWSIARRLLDQVSAAGSTKPAPERDAMVRLWYVATAAWMQIQGHHDNTHLERAREIFPDDADLLFLIGAQHEAYASRSIQTAVRTALLPTGVRLDVGSERSELREAEKFLRRAVEINPGLADAHLRLGRVLELLGRNLEASRELSVALESTDENLLRYYGSLFRASVEDALGHRDVAQTLYEQASTLYPLAQSPLIALSELARRAGHRDEALREMARAFALPSRGANDADPWWTYNYAQGRHSDELLERLRQPFRLEHQP